VGGHRCQRPPLLTPKPSTALPAPGPDDIAYIILHLGPPPGVPKGGGHHPTTNVTQLLESLDAGPGAGTRTRCGRSVIRWPSDVSVWEIFGALLGGGRPGGGARLGGPAHQKTSTPCWSPKHGQRLKPKPPSAVGGAYRLRGLDSAALVGGW